MVWLKSCHHMATRFPGGIGYQPEGSVRDVVVCGLGGLHAPVELNFLRDGHWTVFNLVMVALLIHFAVLFYCYSFCSTPFYALLFCFFPGLDCLFLIYLWRFLASITAVFIELID